MKLRLLLLFILSLLQTELSPCFADGTLPYRKWEQRPQLVVILVIDQFRADYLTRLASRFLPAQRENAGEDALGGFRYLMENSAYFPFAQYPTFQSMTCPGHAILLTGATPLANGIPLNEWYDSKLGKKIYCAEDENGDLSPQRLRTSTVGDELKLVSPKSKVIGLAIKDRAAIMLAGHKADRVLWLDRASNTWVTSKYYTEKLPDWVAKVNQDLPKYFNQGKTPATTGAKSNTHSSTLSPHDALATGIGTKITFTLAKAALRAENLGKRGVPDILAISLSNHDFTGHMHGFGSAEIDQLTLEEDRELADFLNELRRHLGRLDRLAFVLTADHGIAPQINEALKQGLSSDKVDLQKVLNFLEVETQKKFGKSQGSYWADKVYFHFYLNPLTLAEKSLRSEDVLSFAAQSLKNWPGLETTFTRSQYEKHEFPPGLLGEQLRNQYVPGISGDLVFVPQAFFMDKDDNLVTHITGYSYDRQVPLLIMASSLKPAVHADNVDILKLAPTLSFLLGVVSPASSDGHMLSVF